MNRSHGENGRKPLVKLKKMVLNRPKIMGDQKKSYTPNNKVDTTSEIWFLQKVTHVSL